MIAMTNQMADRRIRWAATAAAPPVSPTYRRRRGLLAAAGVLLAVAGCESSTAGRGTAASAQPTSGSSQESGPATASAAPSAADGVNISACADARCEVLVRAGTALPVPASTRVQNLKVAAVTDDRVTLTGHDIGNSSSGLCTGQQCDISSTNGAFTIKLGPNSRAIENGLSVAVNRLTDGTAVLQLQPAS
jgi:hypothetical protein